MSNNAESWNQPNVVSFFDNHRTTKSDVYPSEWFFLKDRLQENMSILDICLLYTSPSPRDATLSRMPSYG